MEKEGSKINFATFCHMTSLHGWNFFSYKVNSNLSKVFWLITIATSFLSGSYMITTQIKDFFKSTVSYNLESPTVTLDDVFFPSVVVCNMNQLRKSFVHSLMRDPVLQNLTNYDELLHFINSHFIRGVKQDLSPKETIVANRIFESEVYNNLYDEFVQASTSQEKIADFSNLDVYHWHSLLDMDEKERHDPKYKVAYFLEIASQFRPKEVLLHLNFNGKGINHDGGGFSTDISETCHWLTPFVLEPGDFNDLRTMVTFARNGVNNGFQLLLDAESYDYASTQLGSEGFTLGVLHQLDIPIMKNTGINIETGQASYIVVVPTLMNTTLGAKRRFTPIQRQCYFEDEISLKHFPARNSFRHDISNCLFEASLQEIEKWCGCVPKYFIDVIPDVPVCSGETIQCMNQIKGNIGEYRTIDDNGEKKVCLSNCVDQQNTVIVSQATYPNQNSFGKSIHFCYIAKKLVRSCNGDRRFSLDMAYPKLCNEIDNYYSDINQTLMETTECSTTFGTFKEPNNELEREIVKYARQNIALVSIFLKDPYVKRYLREEKISEIAFVGTVGGLLGLFLGFSFISGIEILYILCLKLFGGIQQN